MLLSLLYMSQSIPWSQETEDRRPKTGFGRSPVSGPPSSYCEPLLRVIRSGSAKFFCIAKGKKGNLQTAAQMANLVREDAVKDYELERWAKQIVINARLDSHSDSRAIAEALFEYTRRLTYMHDPGGNFDAVRSARETIREGAGDCDDLSVLLATLLAMLGFRPRFVLAKYKQETDGFDHVYVDLDLPEGRLALDPSTRKHNAGWEKEAIERVAFPIFGGVPVGLGGLLGAAVRKCCKSCDQKVNPLGATVGAPAVTFPVLATIVVGCGITMKLAKEFL